MQAENIRRQAKKEAKSQLNMTGKTLKRFQKKIRRIDKNG